MSKARRYYLAIDDDRTAWANEQQQRCMLCGVPFSEFVPLRLRNIHEIERRSHGAERWGHRCNYLLACQGCHAERLAAMSHAEQLAIKFRCDRQHYDLLAWLQIRDPDLRAPNRVTQTDVEAFL